MARVSSELNLGLVLTIENGSVFKKVEKDDFSRPLKNKWDGWGWENDD